MSERVYHVLVYVRRDFKPAEVLSEMPATSYADALKNAQHLTNEVGRWFLDFQQILPRVKYRRLSRDPRAYVPRTINVAYCSLSDPRDGYQVTYTVRIKWDNRPQKRTKANAGQDA